MGTSGLIFALLRRVLPYIHVPLILCGSLKEWPSPHQRVIWTPPWMVNLFHQPEKGLPVTQHSLRPIRAFIQHGCPCYKFSYLFQSGHFTFYSHPQPLPPPPPPPPSGYARFLIGGSHFFLREVDNIWLFEQVFWRALTKKKKRWLTLTLTLPTHHHHQGMVGFLTSGLHFSSEKGSDKNIWLWIPAILTRKGAWVQVKTGTSPH